MSAPSVALGVAAALASAVAYGVNIVYARQATLAGVPPADLVALRVALMVLCVLAVARVVGASFSVSPTGRKSLAILGLLSAGIGLSYFYAVSLVPIGIATLVFYTFPFMIIVASPLLEGEKFSPVRLALFALAFAGLVVALGPSIGAVSVLGVGLAFTAAAMAAGQFFAAGRASRAVEQAGVLLWTHLIMLPIAAAFVLGAGGPGHFGHIASAWFACLMTVLGYLVGFALQMVASRNAPAPVIGLVFCLEPVVAIVAAGFILDETLSSPQIIGGSIVLAALVVSSAMDLRRAKT